ncbi:DUF559 domain-containing protein [Undibacterium arcticum]
MANSKQKFRRQHPFENYILDFVCLEHRLVIEVDGSQHDEQKKNTMNYGPENCTTQASMSFDFGITKY